MQIYQTNKSVLSVVNHPIQFLNGLTSNSMAAPQNALLTIHGRIIATFYQLKISEDEYWLVIEKPFMEAAFKHLDRYAKISGVRLEEKDLNVYANLDGAYQLREKEFSIPLKSGTLILTPNKLAANVSEEEFTLFRLKHHIPLQGVDYKDEFLLNVSMTDLVSFIKGCYLGQEPVAKVYNRSKPTLKLVVKSERDSSADEIAKMTSRTKDLNGGDTLGFVFVKNA